jgi:hypothetical protein
MMAAPLVTLAVPAAAAANAYSQPQGSSVEDRPSNPERIGGGCVAKLAMSRTGNPSNERGALRSSWISF